MVLASARDWRCYCARAACTRVGASARMGAGEFGRAGERGNADARSLWPRAARVVDTHRSHLGVAQREPAAVQSAMPVAGSGVAGCIPPALATLALCATHRDRGR